jgi:hypothetical protein
VPGHACRPGTTTPFGTATVPDPTSRPGIATLLAIATLPGPSGRPGTTNPLAAATAPSPNGWPGTTNPLAAATTPSPTSRPGTTSPPGAAITVTGLRQDPLGDGHPGSATAGGRYPNPASAAARSDTTGRSDAAGQSGAASRPTAAGRQGSANRSGSTPGRARARRPRALSNRSAASATPSTSTATPSRTESRRGPTAPSSSAITLNAIQEHLPAHHHNVAQTRNPAQLYWSVGQREHDERGWCGRSANAHLKPRSNTCRGLLGRNSVGRFAISDQLNSVGKGRACRVASRKLKDPDLHRILVVAPIIGWSRKAFDGERPAARGHRRGLGPELQMRRASGRSQAERLLIERTAPDG